MWAQVKAGNALIKRKMSASARKSDVWGGGFALSLHTFKLAQL